MSDDDTVTTTALLRGWSSQALTRIAERRGTTREAAMEDVLALADYVSARQIGGADLYIDAGSGLIKLDWGPREDRRPE